MIEVLRVAWAIGQWPLLIIGAALFAVLVVAALAELPKGEQRWRL